MTKKITASELWEAVQQIASQQPEYTYQPPNGTDCVYQYEGQPSCLVGHGLVQCGLDVEILAEFDRYEVGVGPLFVEYCDYLVPDDPQAISKLELAQESQDAREIWGKAAELPEFADSDS